MKSKLRFLVKNKQSIIALFVLLVMGFNACKDPVVEKPIPAPDDFTPVYFYVDSNGDFIETDTGRTVLVADENADVAFYVDNIDDYETDNVGFAFEDKNIYIFFEKNTDFPFRIVLSDSEDSLNGLFTAYDPDTQTFGLTITQGDDEEIWTDVLLSKDVFTQYTDDPELTPSQNLRMRNLFIAMNIYKSFYDYIALNEPLQSRGILGKIGKLFKTFVPAHAVDITVGAIGMALGIGVAAINIATNGNANPGTFSMIEEGWDMFKNGIIDGFNEALGNNTTNVTLNNITANGSATQTTTQLTLTFSQAISGLTANHITLSGVSGVTKGSFSGSGTTYTLGISGFTSGGSLNVSVSNPSGYSISGSPKTVTIYYYTPPVPVTFNSVTANGSSSQTTTQLTLTFSQVITGLTANDITLSGITDVTKGNLSGSGPSYTLDINGFTKGGSLSVSVAKSGYNISNSQKTVAIYLYVPPTGVSINKDTLILEVGSKETLTAAVLPTNATNKAVTWSSSATSIASVSSSGIVTGVALGNAVITVSTVDGNKTAECTVTVSPTLVTGVTLNKASTSILVEGTETLAVNVLPSNATNKAVEWSSSNAAVASVSNGLVTGVSVGSATITVSTVDGSKTASCIVTVSSDAVAVTGVTLNKTSITISVDNIESLIAEITPANATNQNVTWSSNNTSVATVSTDGLVTAKAAGNATITATTVDGGKTATCDVAVTVPVTGVTLNKSMLALYEGDTETLIASVAPSNATNKSLSWSSSDTSVATVSSSGLVTAVATGSATITVTTADGNKTASCIVNVSKTLTPANLAAYLVTLSANTASFSHNIILKVTSTDEFSTIRTALNGATNKYVTLDLTGSTVTSIPNNAFYAGNYVYCTTLTGITIPSSVTTIGNSAFYRCGLASVIIPSGVTSIGERAFYDCSSLVSVTIPDSVTSIGIYAFASCTSLASITIPSSVTSIGEAAFNDCRSLTSITIPSSVTSIGDGAFAACSILTTINVDSSNIAYTSENGVLYNKNKTTLIQYPAGKTSTSFTIPSSVTSIGDYAFEGCRSLTSVTIPSGVTSIGDGAFWDCTRLASVAIPSGVTSIGFSAFSYCTSLASITIPSGVTSIGNNAFSGCNSLTSVTIPSSVTSIGYGAFEGCSSLTSVTFQGSIPSSGGFYKNAFGESGNSSYIGDLRDKYFASGGGIGTYTRPSGSLTWTKQ